MAALNIGIILHQLTVSLHITLKLWPGNLKREREKEVQRGGGRSAEGHL